MKNKYTALALLTILTFSTSLMAQEAQYNLFKSKTYVKNPLDLRDPFKRKVNKKKHEAKGKSQFDGVYNNSNESIENKQIENIRIIGVVIGPQRRAMAKVVGEGSQSDPTIYYIKEGMKIGENGAEVKAILPGGIVLVEKIRNVYDQDEYLETVIPVSND